MARWCIHIDILGFSDLWESNMQKAIIPLQKLMEAIFRIGTHVCSNTKDRLFVHQIGDGFAIVSDCHEESFERPILIATALMRHVTATTGNFISAAISEGDFADITGCYPDEVRRSSQDGIVMLGDGIMSTFSVMGTAFIRAHKLSSKIKPSWPFLVVSDCYRSRIPPNFSMKSMPNDILSINWIEGQRSISFLNKIQNQAGLQNILPCELIHKIQDYNKSYPDIVKKWNPYLYYFLNLKNIS